MSGHISVKILGGNKEHAPGAKLHLRPTGAEDVTESFPRVWTGRTSMWVVEMGGATYWAVATCGEHAIALVIETERFTDGELAGEDIAAHSATFTEACGQVTNPEDCPGESPVFLGLYLADQSARVLGCSEWP